MSKKIIEYIYWPIIKLSRSNKFFTNTVNISALLYYKIFRSNKKFVFRNKKYNYFYHTYNKTIASERVVEIPIGKDFLDIYAKRNKKVLEVGNVLSHYYDINHDVLDKYEVGAGVINEDIIDFNPNKKYDLILSLSTLEHVGWSYGEKKSKNKFLKGVKNLQKYIAPGGKMFITIPVDYREDLRKLINDGSMPFDEQYFMKRVSFWNEWIEVGVEDVINGVAYDGHYANANAIYIGIFNK